MFNTVALKINSLQNFFNFIFPSVEYVYLF